MSVLANWSVANAPVSATISATRRRIAGIRSGVIPSGLCTSSTSAPNARIVRIFSTANASEDTIRSGYPFTAQTNASDEPVLPPVYSTTSWPGRRRPSASAASIIARAIRSLYEPVGLAASIFTQTSAQPSSASCASRATGVPPMAEIPPGRSTHNLRSARRSHQQRTAAAGPGSAARGWDRPRPPRSARRRDGEHLASGDHEIVRVARVPDPGKASVERGLQQRSRVVGAQLKPGAEPGVLIVRRLVGELDAEMPATRKADNKHGLVDARMLDGPHRAAPEGGLKAPGQILAPVRAREDVRVAAESDHDLPGPSAHPGAGQLISSPAVASSHQTSITPSGHPACRSAGPPGGVRAGRRADWS